MPELRDPLLKVIIIIYIRIGNTRYKKEFYKILAAGCPTKGK